MTTATNCQIRLAKRPVGPPKDSDFNMKEVKRPEPGEGEVLARTIYLSLDPYMRGRISGVKTYADPTPVGEVMPGGTVGEVVESRDDRYKEGDFVLGMGGWQEFFCLPGQQLFKIQPGGIPISTALGVLGMPGLTAYSALKSFAAPEQDQTFFVSAASGAVGSIAGQIAMIMGGRAIGSAGGPEKCRYVVDELGFDGCIDYKAGAIAEQLDEACPGGIDVNFENVGGEIFHEVLKRMNINGRILLCGYVSQYNRTEAQGPPLWSVLPQILNKRITMRGHLVLDHYGMFHDFQDEMRGWIKDGRIKYREDIVDGLEMAVPAFQGLLTGRNFGKMLVRVGNDPTGN